MSAAELICEPPPGLKMPGYVLECTARTRHPRHGEIAPLGEPQ